MRSRENEGLWPFISGVVIFVILLVIDRWGYGQAVLSKEFRWPYIGMEVAIAILTGIVIYLLVRKPAESPEEAITRLRDMIVGLQQRVTTLERVPRVTIRDKGEGS